jgi:hypothetical protein
MNDADYTQDRELSTEQIAAAGAAPAHEDVPAPAGHQGYEDDNDRGYEGDDVPAPAGHQGYEGDNDAPLVADYAPSGQAGPGTPDARDRVSAAASPVSGAADPSGRASLLEDGELRSITARWKDIQAEFVEEPKEALQQADALVAELMQRLAAMFATERGELENRWSGGDEVTTEDLRQGLRRYRSFFERLLAA